MGSLPATVPTAKVLIIGGSYAGLAAALNLLDIGSGRSPRMAFDAYTHHPEVSRVDYDITIVDERDGFYHTIGSPLALADSEFAKRAWVRFSDIPALQAPNIRVLNGSVTSLDTATKTASILDHITKFASQVTYDYAIAATGLRRVWPVVPQSLGRKQYLIEAEDHIYNIANARDNVVVVGGGAVGIEMAAEIKLVHPQTKVTLVHSRDKLLSSEALSDECKDKSLELLRETGVDVLMSHRLANTTRVETTDGTTRYEIEFTNGHKMTASEVIMAVSKSSPSTSYLAHTSLDSEGYIHINSDLTFSSETPNAKSHFGAGDAIKWSGIKRCGAAMHCGHYVAQNIQQMVIAQTIPGYEPQFKTLNEIPPMIGLAIGKKAVASGPDGTTSGEDVCKSYFGDDLGFTICWNYMQLGENKHLVS